MRNALTSADVYDVNQKTGALVIGSNRLDDYASKFLTQRCPEALIKPMPLPVDELIEKENLTVEFASLSRDLDIFGCCLLLDGFVEVYDVATQTSEPKFFKAGTLLFDPNSEWAYGEGCKRNTLIHELVHWEKDKSYFKVLEQKNKKAKEQLYPIMCRQSRANFNPSNRQTKQNEVQWLEWQAHKLAPRILMPKEMFKVKTNEILNSGIQSCDELVNKLAEFFVVSRTSAKLRLLETDAEKLICDFSDFLDVFADVKHAQDYVPLSLEESFKLLNENPTFEQWIETRGFVFADGYFVLPDKKYIAWKSGQLHLTAFAKKNLPCCAVNIQEQHRYSYNYQCKDLQNQAVLYRSEPGATDTRILAFAPSNQSKITDNIDRKELKTAYQKAKENLSEFDDKTENELLKMLGDPEKSLCNCLWFLLQHSQINSSLDFYDYTHIHENYYGRIRDNSANEMKRETLLAICIGLGLTYRWVQKVFDKSEVKLNDSKDPDRTRIRIIERYPGINIEDFNSLLAVSGLEPIGTKDRFQK